MTTIPVAIIVTIMTAIPAAIIAITIMTTITVATLAIMATTTAVTMPAPLATACLRCQRPTCNGQPAPLGASGPATDAAATWLCPKES